MFSASSSKVVGHRHTAPATLIRNSTMVIYELSIPAAFFLLELLVGPYWGQPPAPALQKSASLFLLIRCLVFFRRTNNKKHALLLEVLWRSNRRNASFKKLFVPIQQQKTKMRRKVSWSIVNSIMWQDGGHTVTTIAAACGQNRGHFSVDARLVVYSPPILHYRS